jgi:hypothetical protein
MGSTSGSDRGEFRGVLYVEPGEAVAFGEFGAEEAVALGRTDEPVVGLFQDAIFEDRDAGGADAWVTVIGGFKIDGGEFHISSRQMGKVPLGSTALTTGRDDRYELGKIATE